jgi:uncharacterized protein
MIHLVDPGAFRLQPWANGRGLTQEMIRVDDPDGRVLWRLSMTRVDKDGPFSAFPGLKRVLTVTDGPGFDLRFPDGRLVPVPPLTPVAFPGAPAPSAERVGIGSADINLMMSDRLPDPEVRVIRSGRIDAPPNGGLAMMIALARCHVAARRLDPDHVLLTDGKLTLARGLAIAIRLDLSGHGWPPGLAGGGNAP